MPCATAVERRAGTATPPPGCRPDTGIHRLPGLSMATTADHPCPAPLSLWPEEAGPRQAFDRTDGVAGLRVQIALRAAILPPNSRSHNTAMPRTKRHALPEQHPACRPPPPLIRAGAQAAVQPRLFSAMTITLHERRSHPVREGAVTCCHGGSRDSNPGPMTQQPGALSCVLAVTCRAIVRRLRPGSPAGMGLSEAALGSIAASQCRSCDTDRTYGGRRSGLVRTVAFPATVTNRRTHPWILDSANAARAAGAKAPAAYQGAGKRFPASSRYWSICRPSQKRSLLPKHPARRTAVSALIARLPRQISLIRRSGTPTNGGPPAGPRRRVCGSWTVESAPFRLARINR